MTIPQRDYVYDATMIEVIDGETVHIDLDLGCGAASKWMRCRLAGIQMKDKQAAKEAKLRLEDFFPIGSLLRVTTVRHKEEKGDRYQVVLHHPDVDEPVNDHLVKLGFARLAYV